MSNEANHWLELSGGSVARAAPLGGIVIRIISPERIIECLGLVCQFTALRSTLGEILSVMLGGHSQHAKSRVARQDGLGVRPVL